MESSVRCTEQPLSLANNVEFLRHLPKPGPLRRIRGAWAKFASGPSQSARRSEGIRNQSRRVADVQLCPGRAAAAARALVVVLHGCGQSAAGYDVGFRLVDPWQNITASRCCCRNSSRSNNANTCFNWFNPEDIARERGEGPVRSGR